jgi:hypothetical protein
MKKSWTVLFWVLLSSVINYVAGKEFKITNLHDSIVEHSIREEMDYFSNKIESKAVRTKNDSLLYNIIYNKNKMNYNGRLVYDLAAYDLEHHESIFIEDTVITKILLKVAVNPTDNGTDEERMLIGFLTKNVRPDYIRKYKIIVKSAFEAGLRAGNGYFFTLYCQTLSKTEKDSILQSNSFFGDSRMSVYTKCALEDKIAVDSLKLVYKTTDDRFKIQNCAEYLGLVSSDTTIPEILMTKWCSNTMNSNRNTVRKIICITLAHIFPDNSIFKNNRELFNTSDKRFALFYNKTKDEQLILRIKELGGETIPDSLVNYDVVKKRVTGIQNWYNKNYKTKITCEVQRPYFTKDDENIHRRTGYQSTPVLIGDGFDTTKFKRVEPWKEPLLMDGK